MISFWLPTQAHGEDPAGRVVAQPRLQQQQPRQAPIVIDLLRYSACFGHFWLGLKGYPCAGPITSGLPRDHAILGIDLARSRQAAVLADHDSRVSVGAELHRGAVERFVGAGDPAP
jgi:hypothetical protein